MWAPEGGAGVETLLVRDDGGAAATAGFAGAAINPDAGGIIDAGVGWAHASVRNDAGAGGWRDVGEHEFAGLGNEALEFVFG